MSTVPSVFTKIINRELPGDISFENDNLIVLKSIDPKAPVHLLVIPKKEILSVHQLSEDPTNKELLWEMFKVAHDEAEKAGVATSGYRLIFNVGPDSGQSVPHVHLHILGGKSLEDGI